MLNLQVAPLILIARSVVYDVSKVDFVLVFTPGMRKNSILWDLRSEELLEKHGLYVDEPHDGDVDAQTMMLRLDHTRRMQRTACNRGQKL